MSTIEQQPVEVDGDKLMQFVFRAVDESNGKLVAVKLIEVREPTEVERSRREAKALEQLTHPAIVRYIADGVTDDDQLFLAMQWVDGTTASERSMPKSLNQR